MAFMSFLGKVPWKNILASAPEIIETIKKLPLFQAPEDDVQSRLAALEKNVSQQAALIEKLAEQNAQLAKTIETLSARLTITFWLSFSVLLLAFIAVIMGIYR